MEFEVREQPFLRAPVERDTARVTTPFAFIGIPYGVPYAEVDLSVCAGAADAVRAASWDAGWAFNWQNMNFDTGRAIFASGEPNVTDCGNVVGELSAPNEIWNIGMDRIRPLAENGVVPLVVGGLDSIPPIVVGAFEGTGKKYNILHVDAHLDFREERYGVTRGFSSPIRRIREFGCVNDVVQVGLRSMGSARVGDVEGPERRATGS